MDQNRTDELQRPAILVLWGAARFVPLYAHHREDYFGLRAYQQWEFDETIAERAHRGDSLGNGCR